ncbi:MAG: hypothetical protein IJX07_07940 [Bacillales bacterium]|nr:hypothetical protein [Bacillales bacterium]
MTSKERVCRENEYQKQFEKLNEKNQEYVLGILRALKFAQEAKGKPRVS